MRASFGRWWLLPIGILTASALVVLGIVVFEPSFVGRSSAEVAQLAAGETAADCSGALANDYACHQERYQDLVHDSGVEAAFTELKDENKENDFVKSNCHQLVHVIGRAAADLYGDLANTYAQGDPFCGSGYYHGAMETIVAKIGPDGILEEADALCSEPRENQKYSLYHGDCIHGLGHGFMGVLKNELFESLYACDTLPNGWERAHCYSGVFMENIMAEDNPSHPSKYLRADQPLYPCTEVEARYKDRCYTVHTSYALKTQGGDFAKVFDLCGEAEEDYRPVCYRGLGAGTSVWSIQRNVTDVGRAESVNMLCALGGDHEARSNCVVGAVASFIDYRGDAQAKAFCGSLDADLRATCLQAGEKYYERAFPD